MKVGRQEYSPAEKSGAVKFVDMVGVVVVDKFEVVLADSFVVVVVGMLEVAELVDMLEVVELVDTLEVVELVDMLDMAVQVPVGVAEVVARSEKAFHEKSDAEKELVRYLKNDFGNENHGRNDAKLMAKVLEMNCVGSLLVVILGKKDENQSVEGFGKIPYGFLEV